MQSLKEIIQAIQERPGQEEKQAESRSNVYLVVGLGNPGRDYRETRHNIGFMLVDLLARRLQANFTRVESKALVTKADRPGARLVMAKPQTFMNLSGQAVSALVRFYKVPLQNMIVAYDDVDLPFGALRLRPAGGTGGHKGMKSIIESLGSQEFARLRMGIGRPPGRMDAADYVLQVFSKAEAEILPGVLERGVEALLCYTTEGLQSAMNKFNPQNE